MSEEYESRTYNPPRTISPEERQRQQITNAVNAAIQVANIQHQRDLANLRQKHADEQKKLEKRLNELNSQFKDNIQDHQKKMVQLREQFDTELKTALDDAEKTRKKERKQFEKELDQAIDIVNANVDDLRKSTKKALDNTNKSINKLRIETEHTLDQQQKQIDHIVSELHNDKAKSSTIKKALKDSYNEQLSIIKIKNHNKYAPNQLDAINARLKEIDMYPDEAAVAILHTGWKDLFTLDANIEQAKKEYEERHIITLKTAEKVLALMNENRNTVSLTDGNNNVVRNNKGEIAKIELDFWTNNEYGRLEEELKGMIKEINQGLENDNYTINDLDKALNRVERINERQMALVVESIEWGNASQIRAEMADTIMDHLEGQRFHVIENGYENNDARNSYIIKLEDNNNKILIIIESGDSPKEQKVIVKTIETNLQEPSINERNHDIDDILEKAGVHVNGGICKKHNPSSEKSWRDIYDMDVINQCIPSETKKQSGLKENRETAFNNSLL